MTSDGLTFNNENVLGLKNEFCNGDAWNKSFKHSSVEVCLLFDYCAGLRANKERKNTKRKKDKCFSFRDKLSHVLF